VVLNVLKRLLVSVLAVGMALAAAAAADEAEPVARGADGLVALPFVARNNSSGRIVCSAALAHWYSIEFGSAARDETVRATLWYDPRSGATFVLNARDDRMPIQALWCGLDGHAWETRAVVALPQRAAAAPPPLRLTCTPDGGGLACR
jgi:hypothetical protein